jgi:hypothetical protein
VRVTKLLRGLLGVGHLVVICGWQLEGGDRCGRSREVAIGDPLKINRSKQVSLPAMRS